MQLIKQNEKITNASHPQVITSEYHMPRTRAIYDKIFGMREDLRDGPGRLSYFAVSTCGTLVSLFCTTDMWASTFSS